MRGVRARDGFRYAAIAGIAVVGLVLLTGCGRGSTPGGGGAAEGQFAARAAEVAQAWRAGGGTDSARLIALGELTQVDGFETDDLKQAFLEGRIGVRGALPELGGTGVVTTSDGKTFPVRTMGATEAASVLVPDQGLRDCGPDAKCPGMVITAATMGTTEVLTNHGLATVPAWRFTVEGMSTPIVRVAIRAQDLGAEPAVPEPGPSPLTTTVWLDQVSADGREVTYRIQIGACDRNPRPLVQEFADIVVLAGITDGFDGACVAMAKLLPVTVTLSQPVGARPLVDAVTGQLLRATPKDFR